MQDSAPAYSAAQFQEAAVLNGKAVVLQVVHRVGVFDTTDDVSDDDMGGAAGVKNIRYVQAPGPTVSWALIKLDQHAHG